MAPTITIIARPNGPAVFAEAHELDSKMIQLVEHFQKVARIWSDSVERSHEHNIKAASPSISHQRIQARASGLRTGNHVAVFMDDFVAALFGHLAQIVKLCLGVLVSR